MKEQGYRNFGLTAALIGSMAHPVLSQQATIDPQSGVYSLGREVCVVKPVLVECVYDIHGVPASTYSINGALKTVTMTYPSSNPLHNPLTVIVTIVPSSQKEKFPGEYISSSSDIQKKSMEKGDLETIVFYTSNDSDFARTWQEDDAISKEKIIKPENLLKN